MLHLGDVLVLTFYYGILAALGLYGCHRLFLVGLYYRNRRARPIPSKALSPLPVVTVQLPLYNERYVVERLIAAVAAIDYPRELLEIQVLDDSTDETSQIAHSSVDKLRREGFAAQHLRRASRIGYKAGALEAGRRLARGEFFLILDADFVPDRAILRESIHFFSDPDVGMVQSRWGHLNRNFSLLTRVQSIFLDGHFVVEHTARNRSGRFFNFNGTAGIWRRQAIEEAGGWTSDTLTEDLDLSYRAQLAGWRFIYLKDLVSPAEVPVDINAFKTQQHRWVKGSIQTGRKLLPLIFRSPLPAKVKLESFFHLTGNMSYLLVIALSFLLYPAMLIRHRLGWTRLAALDIPLFLVSILSFAFFYLTSQREIDGDWRRRARYAPFLMSVGIGLAANNARAVLGAFLLPETEFRRTPKYAISGERGRWRSKKYRTGQSGSLPVEFAFALYFAWALTMAVRQRIYLAIPFLLIFFAGYLSITLLTLAQLLPEAREPKHPVLGSGT
jgi:cellulose synthase/poly-beta-1,6-N-acetylglucosamine synthase-like glycosyltransferase